MIRSAKYNRMQEKSDKVWEIKNMLRDHKYVEKVLPKGFPKRSSVLLGIIVSRCNQFGTIGANPNTLSIHQDTPQSYQQVFNLIY